MSFDSKHRIYPGFDSKQWAFMNIWAYGSWNGRRGFDESMGPARVADLSFQLQLSINTNEFRLRRPIC